MPTVSRHKNIVSRRRGKKEDEDEELGVEEDSYTDDSGISDDDAASEGTLSDEEGEEGDEEEAVDLVVASMDELKVNGHGKVSAGGKGKGNAGRVMSQPKGDTAVMLNGMRGSDDAEVVDFADMGESAEKGPAPTKEESAGEMAEEAAGEVEAGEKQAEKPQDKRRGDHEDYKKRRDADPTFVPNRGGFYLHDHRHADGGNGFRPFARGGARGGRGRFPGYVYKSCPAIFRSTGTLPVEFHRHGLTSLVATLPRSPHLWNNNGSMICTKRCTRNSAVPNRHTKTTTSPLLETVNAEVETHRGPLDGRFTRGLYRSRSTFRE